MTCPHQAPSVLLLPAPPCSPLIRRGRSVSGGSGVPQLDPCAVRRQTPDVHAPVNDKGRYCQRPLLIFFYQTIKHVVARKRRSGKCWGRSGVDRRPLGRRQPRRCWEKFPSAPVSPKPRAFLPLFASSLAGIVPAHTLRREGVFTRTHFTPPHSMDTLMPP
jgi:hypothetical protein